jgi:hypothetical protein
MVRMVFARSAALAALVGLGALGGAQAEGTGLLSHRAVYELTLARADGSRAPASARGLIVFDFQGSACEGYTTTFRQVTEIQPQEGEARASDMTATAYEEGDGGALRFRIETRQGPGGGERVQGEAERSPGGLSIALSRPTLEKLDLGVEAVFPTHQTIAVLAAAREGRTTYETKMYDGSDTGKKIYDTLTVIGKPRADGAEEAAAQDPTLKGHLRWPVSTSYFEEGFADRSPAYVLSYDLYDNGVSRALKLDYGDFALAGELKTFEARATKACP